MSHLDRSLRLRGAFARFGVDEALLLVVHEPHEHALVAADGGGTLPHGPHDVREIEALGELATRVEDLTQLDGVGAKRLVTGFADRSRRSERAHHVVEPLAKLA